MYLILTGVKDVIEIFLFMQGQEISCPYKSNH
ncbi:unknown protein [Simkania negevensis Z]|uniref:Uncharacterized protein n=1 Tax=Simkania negevensis (strain ATCC VR-1471 / DSM 27360 / Z) TaxID=331113 RepID=F8L5Z3_SIMNZ|nr:unknown protein [Simkania negevensis Z]